MSEKPKVLVMEDDESLLEVFQLWLELGGYKAICTENGEDGIIEAFQQKPDLIIADYMMPRMNGIQAVEKLKKMVSTRNIPVIMLTAVDKEELKSLALKTGVTKFLTKPIERIKFLAEIEDVIKNYLEQKDQYQEIIDETKKKIKDGILKAITENPENDKIITPVIAGDIALSNEKISVKTLENQEDSDSIFIEYKNKIAIIHLIGIFTLENAPLFKSKCEWLIHKGYRKFIISFEQLEFISKFGLGELMVINRQVKNLNGQLRLINVNDRMETIFKAMGLFSTFKASTTIDEALKILE